MNKRLSFDPNLDKGEGSLKKSVGFKDNPYLEYLENSSKRRKGPGIWARIRHNCKCAPISWILSLFPILTWLPTYNIKRDLSYDVIAGLTVVVIQIPQGMAYAMLANVTPVVGLFMAFFPLLVYMVMGTSKHVSMGTFAVVCLMTGKTVSDIHEKYAFEETSKNETLYKYTPEEIATVVSLTAGGMQLIMGFFKLGFLCVLLSSDLVSGFTTGAAIHVFTSQVKYLLGLNVGRRNGIFKIPLTYYDILTNIMDTNVTALVFSIIAISVLVIYNEVIKQRVAKHLSIPIPMELITVVVSTIVVKYWITSEDYGIPIVGPIPKGFPTPSIPPLELIKDVLIDSFVLAIVAYTIAISMAKIFATKHNYEVSPNQELIANGASNVVGSFFSCAPISCSLSRSVIQEQVGGKTQMATLVNCLVIVFVLLWIAPFFETLPRCALASMILVALKGMLVQLFDVPKFFKESTLNAGVWSATFFGTVVLDIEYGLGIGILCALLNILWRSNKPDFRVLEIHKDSDGAILVDPSSPKAMHVPTVRIIKYTGSLNFATCEFFAKKLQSLIPPFRCDDVVNNASSSSSLLSTASDQPLVTEKYKKLNGQAPTVSTISSNNTTLSATSNENELSSSNSSSTEDVFKSGESRHTMMEEIIWIILDLSSVSSIDPAASKTLIALTKLYRKNATNLILVGCAPSLIQIMDKAGLLQTAGMDHFHPSVAAALHYLRKGQIKRRRSSSGLPVEPYSPRAVYTDTGTRVEEEIVEDDEVTMVGDTADYIRRLSKSSLR